MERMPAGFWACRKRDSGIGRDSGFFRIAPAGPRDLRSIQFR